MTILDFILPIFVFIPSALLVLYDVFSQKTNYKILKEKIFLKLGILGMCTYLISPYCLVFVLPILIFTLKFKQKSLYDTLCILLVFVVFCLSLMFFNSEGLEKLTSLFFIFVLTSCVTLIMLGLYLSFFFQKEKIATLKHG